MSQSKPVQSNEIIVDKIFDPTIKNAEDFLIVIKKVEDGLKQFYTTSVDYVKSNNNPKTAEETKKLVFELEKASKTRKALVEVEKQSKTVSNQLAKAKKELTDAEVKQASVDKVLAKQRADTLRATAILETQALGLEAKLLAQNTLLRIERAKLNGEEKNYNEELKRINSQLDANNRTIAESSDKQKQQSLNVGNYTDSIVKAIDKTGIYAQVISKVTAFVETFEAIQKTATTATAKNVTVTALDASAHATNTTAIQTETVATEKLSLAKRTLNAITSPVGVLLLISGALAAITKYLFSVNQGFKDFFGLLKANLTDTLLATGDAFTKLEEAIVALRKEIGGLRLALQQYSQDEADFTEISNDATLSLNKQTAALQESIRIGLLKSKQQLEIAKREKNIADLAVKAEESRRGVGAGNANQEFYDRQIEATIKLRDAQDELDDRDRINARRKRERFQNQIIDQIELLRSKKLGADQEIAMLEKQVANEKIQLEERIKINERLNQSNLAAQEKEFELFQKGAKARINFADLVATKDAVDLANKLKQLRANSLSEAQYVELAKIIKEAQENEIDNNDRIQKQKEEGIARTIKIQSIQRDITRIERESGISDLEEQAANAALLNSTRFNDIMVAERAFNNKKIEGILNVQKRQIDIETSLQAARLVNIDKVVASEKQQAIDTINDKKILAAELKKIEAKYQVDRANIISDGQDKIKKLLDNSVEQQQAVDLKKTTITLQELGKVTNALSSELDKRYSFQEQKANREISKTEKNIDRQRALAEKGLDNQLAFEEAKLAKQDLAKQNKAESEARKKEILALVEQYNAFLITRLNQPDANPNTAAALALSDTLLAKGVAKGLVQFAAEGNNMIEGPGTTTSDSVPFMLSKKEAVIKAKENIKHNDAVVDLNAGVFGHNWMHISKVVEVQRNMQESTSKNIEQSLLIQTNNELKLLREELKNKPVQHVDIDKFGNLIETIHENGIRKIKTHKLRPRI